MPEVIPIKKTNKARTSVSAEAFGLWNKKEAFKARTIFKTEEQKKRIQERLKTSLIFSAVDEENLKIVIGAMEEKKYKANQTVIQQGDEGNELFIVDSGTLDCSRRFVIHFIIFRHQKKILDF